MAENDVEKVEDYSEFYQAIGLTENGESGVEPVNSPEEIPVEEVPVEDNREWNLRITIEATIDSAISRGKSTREIVRHETVDIVKGARLNEIIECVTPKP